MRGMKGIGLLVALTVASAMVVGAYKLVAAADVPPASIKGKKLSFAAGATGSAGFARSVQWAQIVNSELGTQIAVETSAGAAAGPTLAQRKIADMANGYMGLLGEAYNGEGRYKEKHLDIRAIFPVGFHLIQFYTLPKNKINSIKDLNGKRVSLSRAGAGVDAYVRRIFPAIGVKPSKIVNLSPSEGTDLLKNAQLDACGLMGYHHPTIIEAASTIDVVVFGIEPAFAPAINKALPTLQEMSIPANIYRGQTKQLVTMGDPEIATTHKDTPEEVVYWIVKATYKNAERMGKFEPSFGASLKEPERMKRSPIPLHKGAYRYFKEIGIDIPIAIIPKD